MADYQNRLLSGLLRHAASNVPYYRNLFSGRGQKIVPGLMEQLCHWPFLTKEIIHDAGSTLLAPNNVGRRLLKVTGGTTGPPVSVQKDFSAMGHELAAAWRGYSWAGINIADRQARFWSTPNSLRGQAEARLTDFICNRRRFTAIGYSESTLSEYINLFTKQRPRYVYGYASMLREFADELEKNGFEPDWDLRAVVSTAECLTSHDRERIELGFKCKVFNEYGCGELGTIAHECPKGEMHINSENLIVELVDESGRPITEGLGEIVVTDLRNRAMPLIRYKTGDLATLGTGRCDCGVTLPTLCDVVGRVYDVIRLRDGRRFHGSVVSRLFSGLEKKHIRVRGYQLVQNPDYSITVTLVADRELHKLLEYEVMRYFREFVSPELPMAFRYADEIPRESSGKIRRVKSMLPRSRNY